MQPSEYLALKELFVALRDLPPEARERAIQEACAADVSKREQIELLLLAHDEAEAEEKARLRELRAGLAHPQRIGEYRILECLGQGGMGVVYRARQEKPDRVVALKVVRPGWLNPSLERRFAQEAEVLGRLQHPGIARIYEAGTADTEVGRQPFFAMELIDGKALDEYSSAASLGVESRLALIAKLGDAIEHAHQKGVIHRDLKPSNILVDAAGEPKILDFGIARITDSGAQSAGQTRTGELIGTLAYMSPEQAAGDPRDVDTRSDVYSLGVVAYELLTGRLPYDLEGVPLADAVRIITEKEARPLGTIRRTLRGDLETIIGKSLFKEADRRYATASEMSADIRRCLNHEPVLARQMSTLYQLTKLARRHRGLVGGVIAALFMLIVGAFVSAVFAIRANDRANEAERERGRADREAVTAVRQYERAEKEAMRATRESERAQSEAREANRQSERAQREAEAANEVSDFLVDLFGVSEPSRARGEEISARDILDRGAEAITARLDEQTLSKARLMLAIGRAYAKLGILREAGSLIERAVQSLRDSEEGGALALANGLYVLGDFYSKRLDLGAAGVCFEEALELRRSVLDPDDVDVVRCMMALGITHAQADRFDEAVAQLEPAARLAVRVFDPRDPHLPQTFNELGMLYQRMGRYTSAAQLLEQSLAAWKEQLPANDPKLAGGHNNLAILYQNIDRIDEAEAHYLHTLEILKEVYPPGHKNLALMHQNLAYLLTDKEDYDRAEMHIERMMEVVQLGRLDDFRLPSAALNMRARAAAAVEDYATATACFDQCVRIVEEAAGPDSVLLASHLLYFSNVKKESGAIDEAIDLVARAIGIRERVYGDEHVRVALGLHNLGNLELRAERPDVAAEHFERAIGIWEVQEKRTQAFVDTLTSYSTALRTLGRADEADRVERRIADSRNR